MPRDKTVSHAKILAAAREEFLEQGFEKASMRRIGERCGMTAAGLYRHCRDKADLFEQLVSPAVNRLYGWLEGHVGRYMEAVTGDGDVLWQDTEVDLMREAVYPHMEDYRLLLTRAQGTKYAHFMHDLAAYNQAEMEKYLPLLRAKGYDVRDIDPKALHLLLSAYTAALFEPVIHDYPLDEALRCLETVEAFFLPGWKSLMGY